MNDTDSDSSSDSEMSVIPVAEFGGAKRKNGHKTHCKCHICENIKNKAKRGGYQEDKEKAMLKKMGGSKKKNGHKPNCNCIICRNMKNSKKGGFEDDLYKPYDNEESKNDLNITGGNEEDIEKENVIIASDNDYDYLDNLNISDSNSNLKVGGTRKKRYSKKSNGHKLNCGYPICKNMKKKKTRRLRKKSHKRR